MIKELFSYFNINTEPTLQTRFIVMKNGDRYTCQEKDFQELKKEMVATRFEDEKHIILESAIISIEDIKIVF